MEVVAGATTFLAMCYILAVQPSVLSGAAAGNPTGMPAGAVFTATALASALGCAALAFLSRLPLAMAPGMGQNFFFVTSLLPAAAACGHPEPWRAALGAVVVAGAIMLVLSAWGLRQMLASAIEPSLRDAIGAGIGVFIALLGVKAGGLGAGSPRLSPDLVVFALGLLATLLLLGRGGRAARLAVPAGILVAFGVACLLAWQGARLLPAWAATGAWHSSALATTFHWPEAFVSHPPDPSPILLKADIPAALAPGMLAALLTLTITLVFDATGSILAVGRQAGLVTDAREGVVRRTMIADSSATALGGLLGSSSTTVFVESAAGVAAGGRTWIVPATVGALFVASLWISPLVQTVASYPPATAPALVAVGAMMARGLGRLPWRDPVRTLPALVVVVGIPWTSSIATGVAAGLVASPLCHLVAGRHRQVTPLAWILGAAMAAFMVLRWLGVMA